MLKVEGSEIKAQLLLALAWFHGIVQERRIFMPQGWTKEYDFSVGDLRWGWGVDIFELCTRIRCSLFLEATRDPHAEHRQHIRKQVCSEIGVQGSGCTPAEYVKVRADPKQREKAQAILVALERTLTRPGGKQKINSSFPAEGRDILPPSVVCNLASRFLDMFANGT